MAVYVVQVAGGRERQAAHLISKLPLDAIGECFVPLRELKKKFAGEWKLVSEVLFPGYLFITTKDATRAAGQLRGVPAFCRLLGGDDERFAPLTSREEAWLEALTTAKPNGEHVMGMSEGVIEGDRVIVTDGPLKGLESQIKKVDRHKRIAYLEVHLLGRTKDVRVGLEIVRKR